MTDIMKLATAYATSAQVDGRHDFDSSKTDQARAALQAAIEALTADRNQLQRDFTYMKQQRDTLRAQLEALQAECAEHKENAMRNARIAVNIRAQLEAMQRQEPVAPEQIEAAWRAGWAACRDAEYIGQEAEDEAWGMSETCANADWDNAAPKALEPLTDGQIESLVDVAYKHWQDKTTFDIGKVRSDFRSVPGIGSQQ